MDGGAVAGGGAGGPTGGADNPDDLLVRGGYGIANALAKVCVEGHCASTIVKMSGWLRDANSAGSRKRVSPVCNSAAGHSNTGTVQVTEMHVGGNSLDDLSGIE